MTTKQKFTVEDPDVQVLKNGRYAYRVKVPWEGRNGKELWAFKFCSTAAYKAYLERTENLQRKPHATYEERARGAGEPCAVRRRRPGGGGRPTPTGAGCRVQSAEIGCEMSRVWRFVNCDAYV